MAPTVSIITPTYNRSKKLDRTIRSVLCQSYEDFEMIIIDDCSSDDTEKVIAGYNDPRIKYIKLKKNTGGDMIPRQIGLEVSKGKYMAVLDDDDFWTDDNKLLLQVAYLDSHVGCVLLGTNAVAVDKNGKVMLHHSYPQDDDSIRNKLLARNCFFHSSTMYRKETVVTIGGYEVVKSGYYSNYSNEYDLWLRMGLVGKLANLPIYGVGYTYPPPYMKFKYKITLLKMYMELINKYKAFYPNYYWAIIFALVVTMLEIPMLSPLKKYLRRFKV